MRVSVIIPVYNGRRFLEETFNSVLALPEVAQLILVDDGSTDGAYEYCQSLAETHPLVELHTHAGRANRSAAASRNLGLERATSEYVSFLDCDDLYLSNRFTAALAQLASEPTTDAVHALVGTRFDSPAAEERYAATGKRVVTGLQETVSPHELFAVYLGNGRSQPFLSTFTFRRSSLTPELRFDPQFRNCSDTDFLLRYARLRIARNGKEKEPVALRRIHGANRIFNRSAMSACGNAVRRKAINNKLYGANAPALTRRTIRNYASNQLGILTEGRIRSPKLKTVGNYLMMLACLLRRPAWIKYYFFT